MTTSLIIADQIIDRIHAHLRKQLPECRGRTIAELTVLFRDLHAEIAGILHDAETADIDAEIAHDAKIAGILYDTETADRDAQIADILKELRETAEDD